MMRAHRRILQVMILFIGNATSLPAQELIENPEFKPAIYDNVPSGAALGWTFYDWTRRELNKKNPEIYYSGYDFYKLNFIDNGLVIDILPTIPAKSCSFTLQDTATFILPMAPAFKLSGEYLLTGGNLSIRLAGSQQNVKVAKDWQTLTYELPAKEYFSRFLTFRANIEKGHKFGVRNLQLRAIYSTSSGEITLPGGQNLDKIIIPPNCPFKQRYAALLLQGYLYKLSGKVLKIEETNEIDDGSVVLQSGVKSLKKGSYHLKIDKNNLVFQVDHPDTLFSAVYNYIRTLGVRFYTGTEYYIPPQKNKLELVAEDNTFKPKYQVVYHHSPNIALGFSTALNGGLSINTYRPKTNDWYENTHPLSFHNSSFALPYTKYGNKQKDMYMMQKNGVRYPRGKNGWIQLCLRSKEMPAIVAKRIAKWMEYYEGYRDFFFEPDDGIDVCQCPECKKHRVGESNSNNMFWAFNQVAANLNGKTISCLAYTERTEAPPTTVELAKNTAITYCTWISSWKCDNHVDCKANAKGINDVRNWAKMLNNDRDRLGFYIYSNGFTNVYNGTDLAAYLNKYGDRNLFLCIDYCDVNPSAYMIARWNWGDSPRNAMIEYCNGVFRRGGEMMQKYFDYLASFAKVKHSSPSYQGISFPPLLNRGTQITQAQFSKAVKLLDEALALESKDSIYRQRIIWNKIKLLTYFISSHPRSACRDQNDLNAFASTLNDFIKTCSEQYKSKVKGANQWPLGKSKFGFNTHTPKRFFFEFAGIRLTTPIGEDWTNDSEIKSFMKDPKKLLTVQARRFYNFHTGYKNTTPGWEWGPNEMLGGQSIDIKYQCPPRQATLIKRPVLENNQIFANFTLDKLPTSPMLLEIIGQDDDKPGAAKWELIINGKTLNNGDNPFVSGDWNAFSIKFPASYLKLGKNNISIVNITPEPKTEKTKGVYDQSGTYLGETKAIDESYGWMAVNRIRLCGMRPPHFKTSPNYYRSNLIYIDPDKKYKVSALAKGSGKFNFRILISDALGKELSVPRISYIDESLTELYAPCNNGDKFILVKDASRWKSLEHHVAFSPQPKPAVAISSNIQKISKEERAWKIELIEPLPFAYPAGAMVACGQPGINGLMKKLQLSQEWSPVEFSFSSEELEKGRPGAKFFSVLFHGKDLSVKNIEVEEVK